jgi:hypothetical protein
MSRQRLRPSQVITTFGPGSIIDLPDDSVMPVEAGAIPPFRIQFNSVGRIGDHQPRFSRAEQLRHRLRTGGITA